MLSKNTILVAGAVIITIVAIVAWVILTTEEERERVVYTFEDYINNRA